MVRQPEWRLFNLWCPLTRCDGYVWYDLAFSYFASLPSFFLPAHCQPVLCFHRTACMHFFFYLPLFTCNSKLFFPILAGPSIEILFSHTLLLLVRSFLYDLCSCFTVVCGICSLLSPLICSLFYLLHPSVPLCFCSFYSIFPLFCVSLIPSLLLFCVILYPFLLCYAFFLLLYLFITILVFLSLSVCCNSLFFFLLHYLSDSASYS